MVPIAPIVTNEEARTGAFDGSFSIRVRHGLSEREEQVLRDLVKGLPNKIIARKRAMAEATVKVHLKSILRKIRMANRTQAAIWALENGYGAEGLHPELPQARALLQKHLDAGDLVRGAAGVEAEDQVVDVGRVEGGQLVERRVDFRGVHSVRPPLRGLRRLERGEDARRRHIRPLTASLRLPPSRVGLGDAFFDFPETRAAMWRERSIRRVLAVQARRPTGPTDAGTAPCPS